MVPSPDGGDDSVGIGSPGEGPGHLVGFLDEAIDGGLEIDDRQMARVEAIVLSMTPHERRTPHLINGPRRRRIAAGSGTTISLYESIELAATTPNGHAYLDGIFSWEPLAVQLREG